MTEPAAPDDDVQGVSKALARNVGAARAAQELTLEELGRRTGLGKARVHRIERAIDNNPTMKTVISLAKGLGMAASQAFRLLSPEGQDAALAIPAADLGEKVDVQSNTLSIELPVGEAFEAARSWSERSGRPVVLIDPKTRKVAGIAGNAPQDRPLSSR